MRREVVWFCLMSCSLSVWAADDTELNYYQPLIETLKQQPITVSSNKTGECLGPSEQTTREDAWRCQAEGKTYDPCFMDADAVQKQVVCAESPWSPSGIRMTVKGALDNSQHHALDMSRNFPWAVELADGEKCQFITAKEEYDGLPIRYRCDKNTDLIGHVQRCDSRWKMLQRTAHGVETVDIAKAWF